MSTVTAKRGGIDTATMDEAKKLLKVVTPEKLMKKFNRNITDNVKLDRFLSGEVTLPKAFQPAELAKVIGKLVEPSSHDHHGLTNVDQQRLILTLLESDVLAVEMAAKTAWIGSFSLDDDQRTAAATKLADYEKQLRTAIDKGCTAWRKIYGANTPNPAR